MQRQSSPHRQHWSQLATAAAVVAVAQFASAQQPAEVVPQEREKPIAAGDDYFVHVLRAEWKGQSVDLMRRVYPGGSVVLHTDRSTGELTRLLESGTFEIPTRRISYSQTRLLGALADGERLYLAVWHSGRIWDQPPGPWDALKGGGYTLRTYRLSDGKYLKSTNITEGVPELAPAEKADAGPLERIDGGVKCFGQEFVLEK